MCIRDSARAEAIFGWSKDEALGLPLADTIIPEQHRDGHRRGLVRFLATGEERIQNRRIEITALRRTGEEFPVELAITPLKICPLYTSDAADDLLCVGLGGRRIIKKKK